MRWTLYGPRFLPVRGDVSHPNQGGFDVVTPHAAEVSTSLVVHEPKTMVDLSKVRG